MHKNHIDFFFQLTNQITSSFKTAETLQALKTVISALELMFSQIFEHILMLWTHAALGCVAWKRSTLGCSPSKIMLSYGIMICSKLQWGLVNIPQFICWKVKTIIGSPQMSKAFWCCQLTLGRNKTDGGLRSKKSTVIINTVLVPPAHAAAARLKDGSHCVWIILTYYVDLLKL